MNTNQYAEHISTNSGNWTRVPIQTGQFRLLAAFYANESIQATVTKTKKQGKTHK